MNQASLKEPQWHRDVCTCDECQALCLDGRSSIEVLLAWLTYEDPVSGRFVNFDAWKGGTRSLAGKSKLVVCTECAEVLKKHGFNREAGAVKNKLIELTQKFSSYCDFMSSTGEGVLNDIKDRFQGDVENPAYIAQMTALEKRKLKICRYYHELSIVMLDRPSATPIVHSSTSDSNEKSAYELLFDDDSTIEKAQSEVDDRDDDSFGEEPLYNPGAPPQPTLQCSERPNKVRPIKSMPNGNSQVPEKHQNKLSKRIKLVGEKDKGKSSIAEAIANGMKIQSETQSQIAERFIALQESQINFENSERVRKRKVDEIFRQGEFMKSAGYSNDDIMKFVNDSMKSLD